MNKERSWAYESIPRNCPCLQVKNIDESGEEKDLIPICFNTFIKVLDKNLKNEPQSVHPGEVMFCFYSSHIFDERFPRTIRESIGISSFGNVNERNLIPLMEQIYWFKEYNKSLKLSNFIRKTIRKRGWYQTLSAIKQSLFTLNGLILKKILAFGPELSSYRRLNGSVAHLFRELLGAYTMDTTYNDKGEPIEVENVYTELKDFANFVKENFAKENPSDRMEILFYKFKNKVVEKFWFHEFQSLYNHVTIIWSELEIDYTSSLAWYYRMTILCQTRILGYLPKAISEAKSYEYRRLIERKPETISGEEYNILYQSVQDALRDGKIPPHILIEHEGEMEKEMFKDIFNSVEFVLKGSASTEYSVSQGGKLEDARVQIGQAKDWNIKVPVRDLHTNEITDFISAPKQENGDETYERFLFWLSYQMALNYLVAIRQFDKKFYFDIKFENEWKKILHARIIHIQEPGKDRILIKSSANLAWMLTPAAKLLQAGLAQHEDFRVGLLGSAHGWKYARRLSGESGEANFIYNNEGKKNENVFQFFEDWSQATDFIEKERGIAILQALGDYLGFPQEYLKVIKTIIIQPQPVKEAIKYQSNLSGGFDQIRIEWNGSIRNGFMMGNPVTKPILHGMHLAEDAIGKWILKKYGIYKTSRIGFPNRSIRPMDMNIHRKTVSEFGLQTTVID
jgi:hypothetical protein